jgi:hypothetical protein
MRDTHAATTKPKLRWYQFSLRTLLLLPVAVALWFGLVPTTLTLYVSNQSSALDPIDVQVEIDGQRLVDGQFDFRDGHNWQAFPLSLRPGWHSVSAKSVKGEAVLQAKFATFWSRSARLDYWYRPADPTVGEPMTAKQFSFYVSSMPPSFQ